MSWLTETTLVGQKITLRPLLLSDKEAMLAAEQDGKLSSLWFTSVPNKDSIDRYLQKALAEQQEGTSLPFAIIDNNSNRLIGSTRFYMADVANRRIEIGYTWYRKSAQRTGANTEAKYLLLRHAFEQLHCIAVIFQTHWHNHKSRAAIARLGAKQEGVIRNHKIQSDGVYRDSVIFSIIENEWPAVKKSLAYKMAQSYENS